MKKVLFFLAALIMNVLTFAQVQVATLQHGDSIRVFYTSRAFVDAYNAAVAGDVISLSAGSFTTVFISKDSLTIRGAGPNATFIPGQTSVGNANCTQHLTIEGINFNVLALDRPIFLLCTNTHFQRIFRGQINGFLTGQFTNCIINDFSTNDSWYPTFINCIVKQTSCAISRGTFLNSVFIGDWSGSLYGQTQDNFNNCFIINSGNSGNSLNSVCTANNCIGLYTGTGTNANWFSRCVNINSRMGSTSIFSNFDLDEMNPERYILTDSAQTALLGSDGTQVGLYGGFMPYTSAPAYPVITRMNVSRQTTADGRLSVDIQVGNVEQSEDDE